MELQLKQFHHQKGKNECWFACFLMVYDYVKGTSSDYDKKRNEIAQREVIKEAIKRNLVGYDPFKDGAGDDVVKELLEEELFGLPYGRTDGRNDNFAMQMVDANTDMNRLLAEVERSLNQGFPAVVGIDRKNTGHFCVVVGVENGELIIVDPLGDGRPSHRKITRDVTTFIYYCR